jgi:Domain of unknown function (DUF1824)
MPTINFSSSYEHSMLHNDSLSPLRCQKCHRQYKYNHTFSFRSVEKHKRRPLPSIYLVTALENPQSPTRPLELVEAWNLLNNFTKLDAKGLSQKLLSDAEQRSVLRDALLIVVSQPSPDVCWDPTSAEPEILLGILSSDIRLAVRSLRDYCLAFGVPFCPPESKVPGYSLGLIPGGVFVKYNSRTKMCYASKYDGRDRGVLVTLGMKQIGHFPLGLMDESMTSAAPQL